VRVAIASSASIPDRCASRRLVVAAPFSRTTSERQRWASAAASSAPLEQGSARVANPSAPRWRSVPCVLGGADEVLGGGPRVARLVVVLADGAEVVVGPRLDARGSHAATRRWLSRRAGLRSVW
jgi:hypothetical protein